MATIKLNKEELRDIVKEAIFELTSEREALKENFKSKHKACRTINENVMERFYGIKKNGYAPVLIESITLDRIIKKHGNNGLAIISANRSDLPQELNDKNTYTLIGDIEASGYSYLPTYGSYRGTDGIEDDYEPSFIVFNYSNNGEILDFNLLKNKAIEWCGKYNQDSVLIKAPNSAPIYVDENGEKVNDRESNEVWKNDPNRPFFTSLKGKDEVNVEIIEKLKGKYKSHCRKNNIPLTKDGFIAFVKNNLNNIDKIGKRYSYEYEFKNECYVNPMPMTLNERKRRENEIMIWNI